MTTPRRIAYTITKMLEVVVGVPLCLWAVMRVISWLGDFLSLVLTVGVLTVAAVAFLVWIFWIKSEIED